MHSTSDARTRVTVLAGLSRTATETVARTLMSDPGRRLIMVSHDLSGVRDGLVYRSVRTADALLESGLTEMAHGCASCTLREDVLPTLVRLGRSHPGHDVLLVLPPAIEPENLAAAAAATTTIHFDSFVTVVDGTTLLDDLTGTDTLRDRALDAATEDTRTVAEVLCHQIEFADTIVLRDGDARTNALVRALAPWAVQAPADPASLLRTARHDPAAPGMPGRALHGYPVGVHDPGAGAVLFTSRRPFHPQRLHDALDDLTGTTLRGRGQLWLASQPGTALAWESTGGDLLLGSLGPWLAALPRSRWTETDDMRRLTADATWDPYYGDRRTALSFVGVSLDATSVTAMLTDCLLTDAEIATGTAGWTTLPDPFADFFPTGIPATEGRP